METDLFQTLLNFLKEENIEMKLQKTSDLEFWLESIGGLIAVKFVIDDNVYEILYDVFSPKYDVHLKEETLRDVEKLDLIAEGIGKWEYEKPIENFWLILDCVKIWARKNGFLVKEKRLI